MSDRHKAPKPQKDSIREGLPPLTPTGRRRRFLFGEVWCMNIIKRNVVDHDKLIAHGVELRLGPRSDLAQVPFGVLLENVRLALCQKIMRESVQTAESRVIINSSTNLKE